MKIDKEFQSRAARRLIAYNTLVQQAYTEVVKSIVNNVTPGKNIFILNNTSKNCNGVVPVKEQCYQILENDYLWFREKPLNYFQSDAKKGGPIDVYKEFTDNTQKISAGLEFETGNISSAHRSMNKLCMGIKKGEVDIAFLMMPVHNMSYFLTDRVSNYEELEPYFPLLEEYPFVVFGFNADKYDSNAPLLPKGQDGMSHRTPHKWDPKNQ